MGSRSCKSEVSLSWMNEVSNWIWKILYATEKQFSFCLSEGKKQTSSWMLNIYNPYAARLPSPLRSSGFGCASRALCSTRWLFSGWASCCGVEVALRIIEQFWVGRDLRRSFSPTPLQCASRDTAWFRLVNHLVSRYLRFSSASSFPSCPMLGQEQKSHQLVLLFIQHHKPVWEVSGR